MELALALFLLFAFLGGGEEPTWNFSMDVEFRGDSRLFRTVIPASEADVTLLAQLIHAEARGEPFRGMVGVGAVVVNRVQSRDYPDTISEVIWQEGQFTGVHYLPAPTEACDECWEAAGAALRGRDPTGEAIFFYNPETAVTLDWLVTRPVTVRIGNHVFAK